MDTNQEFFSNGQYRGEEIAEQQHNVQGEFSFLVFHLEFASKYMSEKVHSQEQAGRTQDDDEVVPRRNHFRRPDAGFRIAFVSVVGVIPTPPHVSRAEARDGGQRFLVRGVGLVAVQY